MNLADLDIVYFVKPSNVNEELRYSLRSVDVNFPHRFVWFIGGKPKGIEPDRYCYVDQNQATKWDNTSVLLKTACLHPEITENFVLFNDDFFVLKYCTYLPYFVDGTLDDRLNQLYRRWRKSTSYSKRLKVTRDLLSAVNLPIMNYATHYPIIINKHEMLKTFEAFPTGLMWRSLYGNHHRKTVELASDCKISEDFSLPSEDAMFVSTQDTTFKNGRVGKYIRNRFSQSCKYEVVNDETN